eukprot:1844359-Pleurochrysis_carterae.AAC.2
MSARDVSSVFREADSMAVWPPWPPESVCLATAAASPAPSLRRRGPTSGPPRRQYLAMQYYSGYVHCGSYVLRGGCGLSLM